MTTEIKLKPENIVLYGRSLGTGPSCYLAAKYDREFLFRGIILQSPFLSIFRIALSSPVTLPGDMFANVDRVPKIRSPLIIVHGVVDGVVPFEHGRKLFAACNSAVDCMWLPQIGHNNIESQQGKLLLKRYHRFIHKLSLRWDAHLMKLQTNDWPK
jgi:pimeloyl-ACP methyl ester carboxylesterase